MPAHKETSMVYRIPFTVTVSINTIQLSLGKGMRAAKDEGLHILVSQDSQRACKKQCFKSIQQDHSAEKT